MTVKTNPAFAPFKVDSLFMPVRFGFYTGTILPSGKLTWQWKMGLLKMYSLLNILLNMGIFHWHVGLLECSYFSWSIALCGGLYDGISMMVEAPFPRNSFNKCHFFFRIFPHLPRHLCPTCSKASFLEILPIKCVFSIYNLTIPTLYLSTTFIYGRLILQIPSMFQPSIRPCRKPINIFGPHLALGQRLRLAGMLKP